jgi:cytidylate kinase
MTFDARAPVIAIDGPSASGKGTIAQRVANALGFRYLDSGSIYRAVAYAALAQQADLADEERVVDVATHAPLRFASRSVYLGERDIQSEIRSEAIGLAASQIAALPRVRAALLQKQRAFRVAPGLVAEGRDMGSVVFPDALLKVFLTASAQARAERRHKQLMEKGINATMRDLTKNIEERDARDAARAAAPLRKMPDTHVLDTTALEIDEVVAEVLKLYASA